MAAQKWSIEIKEFLGLLPAYFNTEFVRFSGDLRYAVEADGVDLFTAQGLGQPFGLVDLTNGTSAAEVDVGIQYVLDYPPTAGVTYAGGTDRLFKITSP